MKQLQKAALVRWGILILVISLPAISAGEDMKPEELVSKHLAAIGSLDEFADRPGRSIWGAGEFHIISGGTGKLTGAAGLMSDGNKFRFSLDFDYATYPGERITFDGKKVRVSRISPTGRSPLGDFLYLYNHIVREGLLGGSLSSAWPLTDVKGRRAKLKYRGLQKVGDRKLHRLTYRPRKTDNNLKIDLYFEEETYRHVRTVYKLTERTGMRSNPNLATSTVDATRINTFTLEEDFGGFREWEGLTLPALWTLRFSETKKGGVTAGNSLGLIVEYRMQFDTVNYGPGVEDNLFKVSENPDAFDRNQ